MRSREELYEQVDALRRTLRVGQGPVDVPSLCEQIPGLQLRTVALHTPGFQGAFMHGEDGDVILLNSRRSRREQTFDCAHELMHWWLHGSVASRGRDPHREWQANEGAAELLVPWRELVRSVYACREVLTSGQNLQRFTLSQAERFGVTEAVIRYRYESLRRALDQARRGVPPEDIRLWSAGAGQSLNALEAEQTGDRRLCAISRDRV